MDGVNPFSAGSSGSFNNANNSSKDDILASYRPISPKPELTLFAGAGVGGDAREGSSSVNGFPERIINSPYLRNVWPHLQARPTQSRKISGFSTFSLPIPFKKVSLRGGTPPPPPYNYPAGLFDPIPAHQNLSPCGLDISRQDSTGTSRINLNWEVVRVPLEIDFMPQLGLCRSERVPGVITPKPVRPVRSTIFVGCMDVVEEESSSDTLEEVILKTAEEVEKEAEAEHHPVVVSDMNNKVRLANSAFKKMVGQPECSWLDCMPPWTNPCRRISGEVVLRIVDPDAYGGSGAVALSNRFSCRVMIEWEMMNKKMSVRASCDAVKLACQSKNYLFRWKFHMITNSKIPSSFCLLP